MTAGRGGTGRGQGPRARDIVGRVQVLGLASAAAVAERYIETVDRYLAGREDSADGRAEQADGAGALALLRLEEATLRTLDLLTGGTAAPDGSSGPPAQDTLVLPPVPAGGCTDAALWVHNPSAAPVVASLRMTSLVSADGHELPPATVVVPSGGGVEVDAGGSLEVRVRLLVPPGTPPGHFHGVVTSTAAPRQCLPVLLQVQAPRSEDPG